MSHKININGDIRAKQVAIGPNAKVITNEGKVTEVENSNSSISIGSNDISDSSINIDSKNNYVKTAVVNTKNQNILHDQDFKEYEFPAKKSSFFINKFGGKYLEIGGVVSFVSGLITILSWLYSLINQSDSSYTHKFVITHSSSIFFFGVILLAAGLWFLRIYFVHLRLGEES